MDMDLRIHPVRHPLQAGAGTSAPALRLGGSAKHGYCRCSRIPTPHTMARCSNCGNDYDKSFEIHRNGEKHTFDSFECAIHLLAPVCAHCGCRIIGHGMESDGSMFCCAFCARQTGVKEVKDRADS